MTQVLLFGECETAHADGASLFALGTAGDDMGVPFTALLRSGWLAPFQSGGEALFKRVWLTCTWSGQHTLRVTPYIDEQGTADQSLVIGVARLLRPLVSLPVVAGEPETRTFEVWLQRAWLISGQERGRVFPRGTRLQVLVETIGAIGSGTLVIDGVECDFEPVQETRAALAGTP